MSQHPRTRAAAAALAVLSWLLAAGPGRAQVIIGGEPPPDRAIDAAERGEVIDNLLKELDKSYVYPETAKKMEEAIRARQKNGDYDEVASAAAFAKALTDHLQEVSKDKHLRVFVAPGPLPKPGKDGPTAEERAAMRKRAAARNFGFRKAERLEGNVGYLELEGFMPTEVAGDAAAAAMNFLADTDALIIDLRHNGGGSPDMVALLCSYLFDGRPVHLNDLYFRPDDSTHQWWTLPYVPGKRYLGKDVYVLTSKRTFSAAEEFTYDLQCLKRATVVGEATGGGAHPGGGRPLNDHFGVFVPSGRAINPVTKADWEGEGVQPDVAVAADRALKTAHLKALRKLLDGDPDPMLKAEMERAAERLEKELAPPKED
jgi:hypothetical protein